MSFRKRLFGEFRDGSLARIEFLVCCVSIFFLEILLLLICLFVHIILSYRYVSFSNDYVDFLSLDILNAGDISQLAIIFIPIYASLNIVAKRFRDIGLPGWRLSILLVFTAVITGNFSHYIAHLAFVVCLLIFLLLFFIPTNFFNSEA